MMLLLFSVICCCLSAADLMLVQPLCDGPIFSM